jgi:hypothetical protein
VSHSDNRIRHDNLIPCGLKLFKQVFRITRTLLRELIIKQSNIVFVHYGSVQMVKMSLATKSNFSRQSNLLCSLYTTELESFSTFLFGVLGCTDSFKVGTILQ